MNLYVECHEQEHEGSEPRRFLWGQRTIQVIDQLERWSDDNNLYYKVQGDDDCIYILCFDSQTQDWEVTSFERREEIQDQIDSSFRHAFRGYV